MTEPTKASVTKAAPKKRVRRTQAQIEADRIAVEKRREELAVERAAKIPQPSAPKFRKLYHFVADGHTVFGKTWYRGEEVEVVEGTEEFELAFDRFGNFVFDKDENEQIDAYGEVKYREGPWTGLPYDTEKIYESGQLGEDGNVIAPTAQEIALLEKANKKRKLISAH